MRGRPGLALCVVLSVLIGACEEVPSIVVADGILVDGWVFPTAAPLPEGAIRLPLRVDAPPRDVPPDLAFGCPSALHEPVTLQVDRTSDPPTLRFLVPDGRDVALRWSYGISAWELDGVAQVVMPDGAVIVREGERSRVVLGGGVLSDDDTFSVCLTNPHRVEPGAT